MSMIQQRFSNFDCCSTNGWGVTLRNRSLWQMFHELDTEMIITKSGRRMFPSLQVQAANLDTQAYYSVILEMVPTSPYRYKYSNLNGWSPSGAEELESPNRVYIHPESPSKGNYWMSQPISFGRLKLTNTANPPPGHVVLNSMHKYTPRIIIAKTKDPNALAFVPNISVVFPETEFIAVTAYQNEKITRLKIDNNPFAKGFRDNKHSKVKRKKTSEEAVEEPANKLQKVGPSPPSKPVYIHTESSNSSAALSPYDQYRSYYQSALPTVALPFYYLPHYPPYTAGSIWGGPSSVYTCPIKIPQNMSPLPAPSSTTRFTNFSIKAILGQE